jgi:hypothetical protein
MFCFFVRMSRVEYSAQTRIVTNTTNTTIFASKNTHPNPSVPSLWQGWRLDSALRVLRGAN